MKKWAIAAALALGASGAMAQELGPIKSFGSISYQYVFDVDDRPTDAGHGVHVSIGRFLGNSNFAIELAGDYTRFGDESPVDRDGRGYNTKLGLLYAFNAGNPIRPYLGIGGGLANNQLYPGSGNGYDRRRRGFGEATVGLMAFLGDNWGLRGEWAYRYTDGIPGAVDGSIVDNLDEPVIRVGLVMALSRGAPPVPPVPPAPTEPAFVDSDGDGVPDHIDECPGTPPGVRVNARGCPIDSDGDGVPDYLDNCPNTPAGVEVDDSGCPVAARVDRKFEDVNFGFDRSDLTDYGRVNLDKTADEIKALARQNPNLRVQVEGHTDSVGPAEYNTGLGQRRAQTVRDYLVGKGVDGKRIETRSLGETRPVASNDTAKGRLLNRRVEVRAVTDEK